MFLIGGEDPHTCQYYDVSLSTSRNDNGAICSLLMVCTGENGVLSCINREDSEETASLKVRKNGDIEIDSLINPQEICGMGGYFHGAWKPQKSLQKQR